LKPGIGSLEGHLAALTPGSAIEAGAGPVVVGVVSVGGELQEDGGVAGGGRGANDEEGLAEGVGVGGTQKDTVVARAPRRRDRNRDGGGPAASVRRRVGGKRMACARDPVASPDDFGVRADAGDLGGERLGGGGDVQADFVAGAVAECTGVGGEDWRLPVGGL